MTVALDDVLSGTEVSHDGLEVRPAGWGARAGAFCIDVLLAFGAALSLLLIGWSAPRGGAVSWVCLVLAALVVVAIGVNRLVAPAITGWSMGRSVFGIAVVDRDGLRPGPWRLLARDAAHLLDTLPLFLGWLWPLIDDRGRTFADLLSHTEVREVDGPRRDLRRLAGTVAAITAALAVLAAGLGYLGVYRPQQAGAEARVEIEDRGPKIVVDMLSYTKDSVDEDFARAQSLVTDGYRPEVIKQQTAVRETGPVDNDYWVSNSAVLSATADRATMLMLLQGQRGAAGQQRFISASVRVDFEKPGGDWKVANLTVLAPPRPSPPAKPESTQDSSTSEPAAPKPSAAKPTAPKPGAATPKPGAATPKPGAATPKPAPPKPSAAAPSPSAGGR
ncbi:MAG: RDD family protein [Actinomycetota bacterium]|nr:RDD family protein [Actinomycetota bacterium]